MLLGFTHQPPFARAFDDAEELPVSWTVINSIELILTFGWFARDVGNHNDLLILNVSGKNLLAVFETRFV